MALVIRRIAVGDLDIPCRAMVRHGPGPPRVRQAALNKIRATAFFDASDHALRKPIRLGDTWRAMGIMPTQLGRG